MTKLFTPIRVTSWLLYLHAGYVKWILPQCNWLHSSLLGDDSGSNPGKSATDAIQQFRVLLFLTSQLFLLQYSFNFCYFTILSMKHNLLDKLAFIIITFTFIYQLKSWKPKRGLIPGHSSIQFSQHAETD